MAKETAAAQMAQVREVAHDIKEAIATIPPAAVDALEPVKQAIHEKLKEVPPMRQEVKEIHEAVKEGRVSVDFAPVFLEMHKYMALIQETVRNGANLSPVLDAIRRSSKSMMKKLEDAEAVQSTVISQEIGSATKQILGGVKENGAGSGAMEEKFYCMLRAIGKLSPLLEAIRDNKMEIDMTEVMQAIRTTRSEVDTAAVLRAIHELRGQSVVALPSPSSPRMKLGFQGDASGMTGTPKTSANNEGSNEFGAEEPPSTARTFSADSTTGSLGREELANVALFGRIMYGTLGDGPDYTGDLKPSSTLNPKNGPLNAVVGKITGE